MENHDNANPLHSARPVQIPIGDAPPLGGAGGHRLVARDTKVAAAPKLIVQGMSPSPFDHLGGERSPSFFVRMKRFKLPARDPNLIYYPLVHLHGQAPLSYSQEDLSALRRHLSPRGGTLFVNGDSRNPAFDRDFRRFVAALLPNQSLTAIPWDDELYSKGIRNDLTNVQYNRSAGGGHGHLRLEGVKIDGHWAIIYSKDDISCSTEKEPPNDPPGYTRDSSSKDPGEHHHSLD